MLRLAPLQISIFSSNHAQRTVAVISCDNLLPGAV